MTRWILSLGTLGCLAFVCACNAQLANVADENGDGGTTTGWGEGTPGADAGYDDPTSDASAGYDGGTITPEDASPGDDASAYTDAACPPPPPPPPPCGCPGADASVDASPADDAAAP